MGFAATYILALLVWVYWHEISLVLEHGAAALADINLLRPDYIQNFLDNRSRGDLALFDSDLSPVLMTYNIWRLFGWVNIAAIGLLILGWSVFSGSVAVQHFGAIRLRRRGSSPAR